MYVGVDLHKKMAVYTALDERGNVVMRGETENTMEGWRAFAERVRPGTEVVFEATVNWGQVHDLLEDLGLRPEVVHSKRVRLIAESRNKTDRIDSEVLAQLSRAGFLPRIHVPPREVRERRELLSYRVSLGRSSTKLKCQIHSLLRKEWLEVPEELFTSDGRTFLRTVTLPPVKRAMMNGLIAQLDAVEAEVERCQSLLAQLSLKDESVLRLMEIRGIDYYSAQILVSWIDDVRRFPNWRKLASYVGLVPSNRSSAEKAYHGHITKEGPSIVRSALVENIPYVVQGNPELAAAHGRIAKRRGSGIARVAVARRLLRVVYYMMRDGTHYRYVNPKTYRRKLSEMNADARRLDRKRQRASRS